MALVMTRHVAQTMMPKNDIPLTAPHINGVGVGFYGFHLGKIGRWMQDAFVTRQMVIKWNSGLVIGHGEQRIKPLMTARPNFKRAALRQAIFQ
jgi:hypothetical protein